MSDAPTYRICPLLRIVEALAEHVDLLAQKADLPQARTNDLADLVGKVRHRMNTEQDDCCGRKVPKDPNPDECPLCQGTGILTKVPKSGASYAIMCVECNGTGVIRAG